jgi:ribA/ribD-fused uncharacterized protein
MAGGFPIKIGELILHGSEILYQCLKYTEHPDLQKQLVVEKNPLKAKWKQKKWKEFVFSDFEKDKLIIMEFCLLIKLYQNYNSLKSYLDQTNNLPIVEYSKKDNFWGAVPSKEDDGILYGENHLGKLWDKIKQKLNENNIKIVLKTFLKENENILNKYNFMGINTIQLPLGL